MKHTLVRKVGVLLVATLLLVPVASFADSSYGVTSSPNPVVLTANQQAQLAAMSQTLGVIIVDMQGVVDTHAADQATLNQIGRAHV